MRHQPITDTGTPVQVPRQPTPSEIKRAIYLELKADDEANPDNKLSVRVSGVIERGVSRACNGEFTS